LSEQVNRVAAVNQTAKQHEIDHLDIVVEELSREIERMSPTESPGQIEDPGLLSTKGLLKRQTKAGTSKQKGGKKGLLSFNGLLPDFLHRSIKALKWEKLLLSEARVKLDLVEMFYAVKFHP
ncbi:hypothetical protein Csa_023717, partial [Cucumis sativus]